MATITFDLDENTNQAILSIAKSETISKSAVVRRALRILLDRQETETVEEVHRPDPIPLLPRPTHHHFPRLQPAEVPKGETRPGSVPGPA